MTDTRTEKKSNPKRVKLSELSRQAEELRETMAEGATTEDEQMFWASRTINYMLLNHMYETNGAKEFNTFRQWKEQGATIKKGEEAFLIWGQPLNAQRQQEAEKKGETPEDEDAYKYFPLCYLFSDKQVVTAAELAQQRERQKEEQEAQRLKEMEEANRETVDLDSVM